VWLSSWRMGIALSIFEYSGSHLLNGSYEGHARLSACSISTMHAHSEKLKAALTPTKDQLVGRYVM